MENNNSEAGTGTYEVVENREDSRNGKLYDRNSVVYLNF